MSELDWQEKLAALKVLTPTHLEMRAPGDWYVAAHGRVVVGAKQALGKYGNGENPSAAVEDDWSQIVTNLPSDRAIQVKGKSYRWAGFMWKEVSL